MQKTWMYNLIEYIDKHSRTCGCLWQYYREEPAFTNAGAIDKFPNNSISFKFKQKITCQTGNDDTKHVEIMVLL